MNENNQYSDLLTISQYAEHKNVTRMTVYYWIKNKYLDVITIAGKQFINKNSNPTKQLK